MKGLKSIYNYFNLIIIVISKCRKSIIVKFTAIHFLHIEITNGVQYAPTFIIVIDFHFYLYFHHLEIINVETQKHQFRHWSFSTKKKIS